MPTSRLPVFIESFAGTGRLAQAVARIGIETLPPQDITTGGTEFMDQVALDELWQTWRDVAA